MKQDIINDRPIHVIRTKGYIGTLIVEVMTSAPIIIIDFEKVIFHRSYTDRYFRRWVVNKIKVDSYRKQLEDILKLKLDNANIKKQEKETFPDTSVFQEQTIF